MKKFLLILLLAGVLGCGSDRARKQFYVQSAPEGYVVALDICCPPNTAVVSRPFTNPEEADALVKKLNQSMAEDWRK